MTSLQPAAASLLLFVACLAPMGLQEPAAAPQAETRLRVSGAVPRPLELTRAELEKLPTCQVAIKDRDGQEIVYEGVPLHEIVSKTGLKLGNDLRGEALAGYLVVEAADGYRVVFALPELDPDSNEPPVLIAWRRNGEPLDSSHGPLQVIVPREARHARWVRQVVRLRVGHA